MAGNVTTHLEIYRSFTDQELADERTALLAMRRGYQQQSAGGKSYTQDLNRIDDQMQALVRVQNERAGPRLGGCDSRATADFGGYGR